MKNIVQFIRDSRFTLILSDSKHSIELSLEAFHHTAAYVFSLSPTQIDILYWISDFLLISDICLHWCLICSGRIRFSGLCFCLSDTSDISAVLIGGCVWFQKKEKHEHRTSAAAERRRAALSHQPKWIMQLLGSNLLLLHFHQSNGLLGEGTCSLDFLVKV